MIWNLIGMAVKTGAEVYKNKKEADRLESVAKMQHYQRMASGEIEYQAKVIDNQQSGYKDEVVLGIVILPILVIAYSVFGNDPDAKDKLNLFFQYFNNLPDWYVWLTVGIFGSIYGLKPTADIFKKK
jgi:hypothetical protein